MIDHKPLRALWSGTDTLLLGLLLATASLLFGVSIDAGEFWWTDESRHAMDGVFFVDLLRESQFADLYDYTVRYFAHYPALGFAWYPPFFALMEALVFALFGLSEPAARLTVLLFGLSGLSALYLWARPIWGSINAFGAGLFFLATPAVLLWGRSVMLEIPSISMILITLLSFHYYLRHPSHIRSLITGILIAAMLLTKQINVFILPVMIAYAFLSGVGRRLWSVQSLWAYLLTAAALALLALHAMLFGLTALGGINRNLGSLFSEQVITRLSLNAKIIWAAYPLPLLLAALGGLLAAIHARFRRADLLLITWMIVWYLFFSMISHTFENLLRYSIYLTPALGLLAMRSPDLLPERTGYRNWVKMALIALFMGYSYAGLRTDHPMLSGYTQAAEFVLAQEPRGTTLFCCKHDGNFIFHIRKGDPERRQIILRADKTLVSMAVHKLFGVTSYVEDQQDIFDLLDRYGVEIIVTEASDRVGLPEFELLLTMLNSDRFESLTEIPVTSTIPGYRGDRLLIYRYKNHQRIESGEIIIPAPHIGRELRLPVAQ